ncbi:MAG: VTT domain-containing protein [Propionibacterium sp.]|nr:VTT domain-containing protein [Propionibacterium sp.]
MLWLVLNVQVPSLGEVQGSVDELRDTIGQFGWAALPIFAVAYAAVAVTPIPVTVMAVTAGILFGTIEGSIVSVVGVLIGCWGAYWLARALGHDTVRRLLGRRSANIEERLSNQGFATVFLLRVMPGMPYWPVNYGSGAFGVGQRDFVIASGLAAIPGQISLVAIGAFVVDPSLWTGIVVAVSWAVVIVMTVWSYKSLRGTSKRELPGSALADAD